jgi:hypothetical protein
MKKYQKIDSIYKRDEKNNFIIGDWANPVFGYLKDNLWLFEEKINGTNLRVYWDGLSEVKFGGRTDDAQMPMKLLYHLQDIFPAKKFMSLYPGTEMTLYGEGVGPGLAKGSGSYSPNGYRFILFDVVIGGYFLTRENVEDIGSKVEVGVVPTLGKGTIETAIEVVRRGFNSVYGDFKAEGLVLKPEVQLFDRMGNRVITKIKSRDFR